MIKIVKNHPLRFCLKSSQSPTYLNLCRYLQEQGWRSSPFAWRAHFSDKNFQFDLGAAQTLEYKHLLADLVNHYCPEVIPETYCLNDQNWPAILSRLADQFYLKKGVYFNQLDKLEWILKPALLNNGKGIKIFRRLSDLEQHFLSSARLGGEHVLQRYLSEPHLLREQHKYSIRMFVVATNYAGCYLYPKGYFNVALQPYEPDNWADLCSHLTNEHLHEDEANVVQIPSYRFAFFPSLYTRIKPIISSIVGALKQQHPQAFTLKLQPTLALFGFDFMVDNHLKLWLLEANHGPCFPISDAHPLQSHLYQPFWQNFIASFVMPIAQYNLDKEINPTIFEALD